MASTSASLTPPVALRRSNEISTMRRVRNRLWWGLCFLALLLLLVPVLWIFFGVVGKGISTWHWSVLTHTTSGIGGYGLANELVGTLVITVGVAIIAGGVGILAGIYLAEIAHPSIITTLLRSAGEVLAGVPSIVFGFCGYLVLVVDLHWGFSLLPAVIVLSMLVVPYIAKATELALNQVPVAYREGAEGLGMSKTYLLRKIVLRSAIPGILTGLIIALAISVGETAPLLYTAGNTNAYPSAALIHDPVGFLTYAVYTFIEDPSKIVQALSYDASLILIVIVLALILTARLVVRLSQKFAPNRAVGRPTREERRAARELAAGTSSVELAQGRNSD